MTALFIAQIGDFDFADYVRVGPSDGLDPYGKGWAEPQFAQSAFGDGQPLTGVTVGNREMVWPLYLNRNFLLPGDDLTPEEELLMEQHIHELVVDMNRALAKPNLQLQWCDSHAPATTYYDVAYARFDPDYNHRQDQFGWKAGTLRVWCSPPWGHTGTHRIVGTAQSAGRVQVVSVGTLLGDTAAAARVKVTAPAVGTEGARGRIVGFAALPNATYPCRWPAASITAVANATVTTAGASDMQDNRYVRVGGVGYRGEIAVTLTPASQFHGARHRVFALARADYESGMELSAKLEGVPFGATAVATNARGVDLVDLGAFETGSDDPRSSLRLSVETWHPQRSSLPPYWDARSGLVSGQGVAPAINQLVIVPEDRLTLLRDDGDVVLGEDAMQNTLGYGVLGTVALIGQYDGFGNQWASHGALAPSQVFKQYNSGLSKGFQAASYDDIGGGLLNHRAVRDMRIVAYTEPGYVAATHTTAGLCKMIDQSAIPQASGAFVFGYLHSGPTPWVSLHTHTGGSTTLRASQSVAMATGPKARLELVTRGNTIAFSVHELQATAPAYASVGATVDGFDQPGQTMLLANMLQRFLHVSVAETPRRPVTAADVYWLGDQAHMQASGGASVVRVFGDQVGGDAGLPADDAGAAVAFCVDLGSNSAAATCAVEIRAQERFHLAR